MHECVHAVDFEAFLNIEITYCFFFSIRNSYLRKSCDLASIMSVSIPSGCKGNPDRSDAIARITVASRSLQNQVSCD